MESVVRRRCSLFLESASRRHQTFEHLRGHAKPRPQPERITQRGHRQKDLANFRQRDAQPCVRFGIERPCRRRRTQRLDSLGVPVLPGERQTEIEQRVSVGRALSEYQAKCALGLEERFALKMLPSAGEGRVCIWRLTRPPRPAALHANRLENGRPWKGCSQRQQGSTNRAASARTHDGDEQCD